MTIAFSGTQTGMTIKQETELMAYLALHCTCLHHGDCIGADAQAHSIARSLLIPICIHPPIKKDKRAFCTEYSSIYAPKEYLSRNHEMVDVCEALIACPKTKEEVWRSGTWATIRYASKMKKPVIILSPA